MLTVQRIFNGVARKKDRDRKMIPNRGNICEQYETVSLPTNTREFHSRSEQFGSEGGVRIKGK